jgi:hypothetical protein
MAECITRLKEKACPELVEAASQTLKDQITATDPYRYRLGGIARALLHIRIIGNSAKNSEYQSKKM